MHILARAIIHRQGKYLLVRNKDNDFWCLPGGGVEPGESIPHAVERELVEELGVRPSVGQLLYVQQFQDGGSDFIEFIFLVNNPEDYADVDLTKTTHGEEELGDAGFYGLDEVPMLPKFLRTELPGLLKNYTPGVLPHFRASK